MSASDPTAQRGTKRPCSSSPGAACGAGVQYSHGALPVARGLGAALLDLDQPDRLIARARRWLLGPQMPYERTGDIPNVVFSCGGFVRGGELWLYYGAADSSICLARADLAEVIDLVIAESTDSEPSYS